MPVTVRELNEHFIEMWWRSDSSLPDLGPRYTVQAQTQNETHFLRFLDLADQLAEHPPHNREEAQERQVRLGLAFRSLAEETLGFTAEQLDLLPSQAFSDVSEEFVQKARAFDSHLRGEDIYQAGRNAWTANGLQWLMGRTVQITPSIFAYSLLYPYTDNYLDDPAISPEAKRAFNERFRMRLAGERLPPNNPHEQVIFDLVAMIEKQYSRLDHPGVFDSLLEIHEAQAASLQLVRHPVEPALEEVLRLSFNKGGTSVMADGYLVSGSLEDAQRQYTYGHGVLAQLLDDMEDVELDRRAGRLSLYSRLADRSALDALASRTFQFSHQVFMGLDAFPLEEPVRELIRRGADLLLLDAVSRLDGYYSEAYLHELETFSPFRFSLLKEQRQEFERRHGSLMENLERSWLFSLLPSLPAQSPW